MPLPPGSLVSLWRDSATRSPGAFPLQTTVAGIPSCAQPGRLVACARALFLPSGNRGTRPWLCVLDAFRASPRPVTVASRARGFSACSPI